MAHSERSTIDRKRPLGGVRVLDLTRAAAGPFCTMILGDFGADVVKIETTPNGDLLRAFGPFDHGEGTYFLSINRNKRSILIDVRKPEGLALVQEMAAKADVLVENFKPGVADTMGLGYDTLKAVNPKLVYASVNGFGSTGPYGGWPGVDQIAQGMSGFMSVTGTEASGPLRVGVPIGDLTAGMWTALGIMGALNLRADTGVGQRIETSLLDALVSLLSVQGQRYLSLGDVAGPVGNDHPVISPYGLVQAGDGPLNICVATQEMWGKFCHLIGRTDLIHHPDYADNTARARNRAKLTDEINAALASESAASAAQKLVDAGIPAGPIYRTDQLFNDPHVMQSGLVTEVDHSSIGALRLVGNPIVAEFLRGVPTGAPPLLGEHGLEVLRDYGVEGDRADALVAKGIVQRRK